MLQVVLGFLYAAPTEEAINKCTVSCEVVNSLLKREKHGAEVERREGGAVSQRFGAADWWMGVREESSG